MALLVHLKKGNYLRFTMIMFVEVLLLLLLQKDFEVVFFNFLLGSWRGNDFSRTAR